MAVKQLNRVLVVPAGRWSWNSFHVVLRRPAVKLFRGNGYRDTILSRTMSMWAANEDAILWERRLEQQGYEL